MDHAVLEMAGKMSGQVDMSGVKTCLSEQNFLLRLHPNMLEYVQAFLTLHDTHILTIGLSP